MSAELKLESQVASLSQIGKSNNSHVYKELDKKGNSLQKALKIIVHQIDHQHSKECLHLKNEFTLLKSMSHPNIVQLKGKYYDSNILQKNEICAMEVELADKDLFEHMSKMYPKILSANEVRMLFTQIAKALEYCHNEKGVAHNDIKLENIFMFQDGTVAKLADFGFAREQETIEASQQYQNWKNRCKSMLSPEILSSIKNKKDKVFDEKKSDVWALGLTLFQAVMLRTPFVGKYASKSDLLYSAFFEKKYSQFWKNSEISAIMKNLCKQQDFRMVQFVDLMNKMLCIDPEERISIQQVLEHPWFAKKCSK